MVRGLIEEQQVRIGNDQASQRGARLLAAARLYLARRPDAECRFDVLLLDALEASRVQWIRNAFTA